MHRNNNDFMETCCGCVSFFCGDLCNTLKQHCLPEVNTLFLFLRSYSKQLINQQLNLNYIYTHTSHIRIYSLYIQYIYIYTPDIHQHRYKLYHQSCNKGVGGTPWRQVYSNGSIWDPLVVSVWVENPGIACQMCWWFNAGDFLMEAITS